ncbi:hypothetical protein BDZ94DRAFT_1317388 [Collybia nuda]|uniref:Manganese/iron superoxide dismutase C-terminal domain-containing protein n=1 Tax=Collybia nuda TaxID=64659 RepID=A0A9P5YGE5_9AGAR|nr:hypothetical protein BDZ94DRAFT_1317388 [Collybia nuda]
MSNLGLRCLTSSNVSRTTAASRLKSRWGTRNIHKRRSLLYPVEDGLGDFLPPAALKAVAEEYHDGLLQRLNEEVRGTEEEGKRVVQTLIDAAPHREKTLMFNYASLALNNSFFLDQLKPPPAPPATTHQDEITSNLGEAIRMQHGSIAQLKSSFSAAAMGMFTSGYVWFVTDKNGNTGVIPTFGPGSLLIRSRTYMAHSKGLLLGENLLQIDRGDPADPASSDPADLVDPEATKFQAAVDRHLQASQRSPTAQPSPPGVSPSSPTSGVSGSNTPPPTNALHPRFLHSSARTSVESFNAPSSLWDGKEGPAAFDRSKPQTKVDMLNIGETLFPLFCVSVHEHAWISAGYGVWGKEEWLKKFWTVLDWAKVSNAYTAVNPDYTKF